MWDTIVIGSGIGGLAAAAALAKSDHRILVLEQHDVAGGLTHTFKRHGWTFAPGVHYIGGVGSQAGADGQFGRLLAWLSNGELRFELSANPYDIIHLPGFEFGIEHPESAYSAALLARFPEQQAAIERWFLACAEARGSAQALFALHSMPSWLGWGLRLWHGAQDHQWATRTLGDELAKIEDPQLQAVLGARWADYGALPVQAPFAEHALVTGSYNAGSYYPVGGPARFAQTLVPVIEAAGGAVELGAVVKQILTQDGRACGVAYEQGGALKEAHAPQVISAMGVANTVACLRPDLAPEWQESIRALAPGLACVSLFIGLEGDLATAGASSANHWIYESNDISLTWRDPAHEDTPSMFVSFPSQKDPGNPGQPTAEVVAVLDAAAFAPWLALPDDQRTPDYLALKDQVKKRLLAQFLRHFPKLEPMVRFHELATPLTQRRYVGSVGGAMYGIEMTNERLASPALHVHTPLPGLTLAGQDVTSPGVAGAFMGGLLGGANVEPALWAKLRA
jgi:all-trans-retinol 13,14-reductase